MILNDLYKVCARLADEDIGTSTIYAGKILKTVENFRDGINYATRKIAREKHLFNKSENIKVQNNMFDTSTLTEQLFEINNIVQNNRSLYYENMGNNISLRSNGGITVYYEYIPKDYINPSDVIVLPGEVDYMALCYYGAFNHLNIQGDVISNDKALKLISLFNDAFDNIRSKKATIILTQDCEGDPYGY